jgi:uncharacterized protein YndB with AHSA1/START domain
MSNETITQDKTIVIKRVIKSPIERVYEAWTNPELMAKWFLPNERWLATTVDIELKPGGKHNITMNHSDGDKSRIVGHYLEIIPNKKLSFTWKGLDFFPDGGESIVTIDLRDLHGETELVLTHDRITDPTELQGTTSGWDGCLTSLEHFLAAR